MTNAESALHRKTIINTGSQLFGRIFGSLGRLVAGGLIVRAYGRELFGEYSLILTLVALAEWVLDFGTADIFVREMCRQPERRRDLLRVLTAAKLVQIPVAALLLGAVVLVAGYSHRVVEATIIAGGSLVFAAGIQIYRAMFRSSLTMQKEIVAELISVAAMIPATYAVIRAHGGLLALALVYSAGRGVMFLLCAIFGMNNYRLSVTGVRHEQILWGLREAAAIGAAGFGMVLCDSLDLLVLPRFGSLSDLGYYSGAQKLVWPLLIPIAAVGSTLFSVAAGYWPLHKDKFYSACQRGLVTQVSLVGLILTPVIAGAPFLLRLLGPDLVAGAPALQILAMAVFVKAISLTLSAVLPVVHGQKQAMRIVGALVVSKALIVACAAKMFGYIGVAWAVFGLECCFASIAVWLIRRTSGFSVDWRLPLRVGLISAAAVYMGTSLSVIPFWAGGIAAASYVALLFVTGTLRYLRLPGITPEPALEAAR